MYRFFFFFCYRISAPPNTIINFYITFARREWSHIFSHRVCEFFSFSVHYYTGFIIFIVIEVTLCYVSRFLWHRELTFLCHRQIHREWTGRGWSIKPKTLTSLLTAAPGKPRCGCLASLPHASPPLPKCPSHGHPAAPFLPRRR